MIKKLKLKFILTNMILISVVILASFASIYLYTANDLRQTSSDAMHDIAESGNRGIDHLFDIESTKSDSRYSYLTTYTIDLNEISSTCYIDGFGDAGDLTEEQTQYVNDLINQVNAQASSEGVLEQYNLRYYYVKTPVGKKIVLLDKDYEDETLLNLILIFSIVGVVALSAFLIISIIVAGLAVSPVEKSLRQQKQLVSDASHELKTPITVISANADIILSHPESTVREQKKWIEYIKDENSRMSDLVSNMLFLAKTDESIKSDMHFETDISSAAYEVALPFESVCFEKGKKFSIDIAPDLVISAEQKSVKQLIVILLDNAVKYSDEKGSVALRVYPDSDRVNIAVFNTGTPIPKDSIPFLFERFYRVDESRSREQGGSGLGLSIAKRIIETNEGRISVASDEKGTVFTCSFKKKRGDKKKPEPPKDNNEFTES